MRTHENQKAQTRFGDIDLVIPEVSTCGGICVRAFLDGRCVGKLLTWKGYEQRDDALEVYKVFVEPECRRGGVARALYEAAERHHGVPLVPSRALSEDGFQFWLGFRPSALEGDLRLFRDELHGMTVETENHGEMAIYAENVQARNVIGKKPNGMGAAVPRKVVAEAVVNTGCDVPDWLPQELEESPAPESSGPAPS